MDSNTWLTSDKWTSESKQVGPMFDRLDAEEQDVRRLHGDDSVEFSSTFAKANALVVTSRVGGVLWNVTSVTAIFDLIPWHRTIHVSPIQPVAMSEMNNLGTQQSKGVFVSWQGGYIECCRLTDLLLVDNLLHS